MSDGEGDPPKSCDPTAPIPAEDSTRRLKRGDTLGGRFVIVQFLADGGMGEVYEAADLHLQGKHCALKTLRSDLARNPGLRLRFQREVVLAREVHHPNVCPTYDLFRFDGPDGQPITFLTMKLLRGESLQSRLKRIQAFEPDVLDSLARQMAGALDAAHRVGVIHRDFKPGNVMVEQHGQRELQIVITDFGLSRAQEADATLAETGQILGTPGYIAPELIQGRVASFTADVYAFGVVLYEMSTGQKPLPEGIKPPAKPTSLASGLPAVWDRIILGCLEADPSKRFQSAGEAVALLDAAKSTSWTRPIRSGIARRFVWAGALLMMLAALVGWVALQNFNAILHPLPQKRFVALMAWPAAVNSANSPLLKGVLDTIDSRLARAERSTRDLLIISPDDVAGAAVAAPVDALSALGANLVLAATVRDTTDGIALDLAVLEAGTSKTLRKTELLIGNADLSHLPDRAAVSASKLLDVQISASQWKDQDDLGAIPPAAYRHFAVAEDLAAQPNDTGFDQAIEQYEKAIELDPKFSLAYALLSKVYIQKFNRSADAAFLAPAARNADLAIRYNPGSAQAVLSRAIVDSKLGKIQEALDGLQLALKLDPGNPQILLNKGRVLRDLDRRTEEEAVYRDIIKERPNYWPAYNELGIVLSRRGQYQTAVNIFAEGSVVAPRVGDLYTNRGAMLLLLGQKKEAEQAFEQSVERRPSAAAYSNLGTIAFDAKDYRKALMYYLKAKDLRPRDHTNWRNLGDCYAMLGDQGGIRDSYAKAAAAVTELLQTNPRRGAARMDLAFYQAKLGKSKEAEQALQDAEERGSSDLTSRFKKAQVLAVLGRRKEALTLLLDCLRAGLSTEQVALALDLRELTTEPLYIKTVEELNKKNK